MRSWRNLKDFARAATPVTRPLWGGSPGARNSKASQPCLPPQSRRASALTTAHHSMLHPAGFLLSVDASRKWARAAEIWCRPGNASVGGR